MVLGSSSNSVHRILRQTLLDLRLAFKYMDTFKGWQARFKLELMFQSTWTERLPGSVKQRLATKRH